MMGGEMRKSRESRLGAQARLRCEKVLDYIPYANRLECILCAMQRCRYT